jgi:hypothetical protein
MRRTRRIAGRPHVRWAAEAAGDRYEGGHEERHEERRRRDTNAHIVYTHIAIQSIQSILEYSLYMQLYMQPL